MSDRTTLLHHKGFVRFWAADTVSLAGTHVTALALKAVAVLTLGATAIGLDVWLELRQSPQLAKLDSIDQNALLPVDRFVLTGNALHFEIAAVKGAFGDCHGETGTPCTV